MRTPSIYAQQQLVQLTMSAGVQRADWDAILGQLGLQELSWRIPTGQTPLDAVRQVVEAMTRANVLDASVLDLLGADPRMTGHAQDLDGIRVELEMLEPPQPVVSRSVLDEMKQAALMGDLHQGAAHAVLGQVDMPLAIRQRSARVALDKKDQVCAWFDAANRQWLEPGVNDVWLEQLLEAATKHARSPGLELLKKQLNDLRASTLKTPTTVDQATQQDVASLESIVQEAGIMLDGGQFLERMARALPRVCLIRYDQVDTGTGFLVGPDLVLTNYHVLEHVIAKGGDAGRVDFVFDYRSSLDQSAPTMGPRLKLALDGATEQNPRPWLIDALPPTAEEQKDIDPSPDIAVQTPTTQLDFALVRLERRIGDDSGPTQQPRGWFPLIREGVQFAFRDGIPLIIVGHPRDDKSREFSAQPITWSMAADSFKAINPNQTRVQYLTNTLSGSSGSPVLSAQWEVVALHHFGKKHRYNQGIPIAAITHRDKVKVALSDT